MTPMLNILIIDDNPDDRESCTRALRKAEGAEYRCVEASSGQSGLELIRQESFDCILLDYSLPGMDGIEVLKAIRMHNTFLPVILLTGQGNEVVAVSAIKKGAHDYITKGSVDPERLHHAIQSAISQSQLRRDIVDKDAHIRDQAETLAQTVKELTAIKLEQEKLITKLVESNTELERFAFVCSHDLQEPLRMIVNYVQRLERHLGKSLDERGRHYMGYVTSGAYQARQLITDVLNYARIDHEDEPLETINSEEVLWNVLHNLSERIKESEAKITHDMLPTLRMQPTHLRQILQNLISNALKFCDGSPVIHISAAQDGEYWRLGVHDKGIGIPQPHWDNVFSIFQRLNTRDQYPGNGIGLALCRKVTQIYGGRIWVESVVGKGSSFYFTLPEHATNLSEIAEKKQGESYASDLKKTSAN